MTTVILSADDILAIRQREAALAIAKATDCAINYINAKLQKDYHLGKTVEVSVKEIQRAAGTTLSNGTLNMIKTAIIKGGWKVNLRRTARSPYKVTVFEISK